MFKSDVQLVWRVLAGESQAFAAIYDRHAARVYRLLRQLTGSASEAEDLTQETFIAAYHALQGWRREGAFGTWLCGIAYKRYANARRRRGEPEESLDARPDLAATGCDPFVHCARREQERRVERAIALLPPLCRDVFVLVKVDGLTYREAARMLDVPVGTVQSRLWRAVRLLQAALAGELEPQQAAAPSSSTPARIQQSADG